MPPGCLKVAKYDGTILLAQAKNLRVHEKFRIRLAKKCSQVCRSSPHRKFRRSHTTKWTCVIVHEFAKGLLPHVSTGTSEMQVLFVARASLTPHNEMQKRLSDVVEHAAIRPEKIRSDRCVHQTHLRCLCPLVPTTLLNLAEPILLSRPSIDQRVFQRDKGGDGSKN